MSISRFFRCVVLLGYLFSAGCASLEPLLASLTPSPPAPTPRPTPTPLTIVTETPPPQTPDSSLRLWLPVQFDPAADNDPAKLLAERLAEFESQHPGIHLEVRLKRVDSENDIINALSLTSAAAPDALPDLILLSRPDLEAAALRGLLHPIDGLSTSLEDLQER